MTKVLRAKLSCPIAFQCRPTTWSATDADYVEVEIFDEQFGKFSILVDYRDYDASQVVVKAESIVIDDELFNEVFSSKDSIFEQLSNTLQEFTVGLQKRMIGAAGRVLDLVRYLFLQYFVSEDRFKYSRLEWSIDGCEYWGFPERRTFNLGVRQPYLNLDCSLGSRIQAALDGGVAPLDGLRYIARAKNEPLFSYSWIDATIGAELAAKDALQRKCPNLRDVLSGKNCPSITKLYGQWAKTHLGEASPFIDDIERARLGRNQLIHRPHAVLDGEYRLQRHLYAMDRAALHLMTLLHPGDEMVRRAFEVGDSSGYMTKISFNW